jgi:hypothetical protein
MHDARVLFVLSTGRCGTRSLWKLLSLSPDISAHHEPKPKADLRARQLGWLAPIWVSPWNVPTPIDAARAKRIRSAQEWGLIYAETAWDLTAYAYRLEAEFPKAKFIFLHRHPREWMLSWLNERVFETIKSPYTIHDFIANPKIAGSEPQVRTAWWWEHVNNFSLKFYRQSDRCMRMSCESLWSDHDVAVGIFKFLGASVPSKAEIEGWATQKYNPGAYRGVDWDPEWDQLLPRELMKKLGYT